MTSALPKIWSAMYCRGPTATPSVMLPAVTVGVHALHVVDPPFRWRCTQVVHVVENFCLRGVPLRSNFGVGDVKFLQEGRHQDRGDTQCHCRPCITGLPERRKKATHARVVGTGTHFLSAQLADSCILVARSALSSCCSEASSTPIDGRLPAACCAALRPGVSAATFPQTRLHSRGPVHLDPSAVAGAPLVQYRTGSDVFTLLLLCASGRNHDAASRTACHSVIPKQFFSSTLILASGPLSEPVVHSSLRVGSLILCRKQNFKL